MKWYKLLLKLLVLLMSGIVIGFLLMLSVYALPVEPMAKHVQASVPAMNGMWAYEDMNEQLLPGYQSMQLDNTTDSSMLIVAAYQGDEPLVERATECYRYVNHENAYQTFLTYGETGPEEMERRPIARYWHGYLLFLKPLLLFLSYIDIRMVLVFVEGSMMAAVIAGLTKQKLGRLIPSFLLSLVIINPVATGFSMQFSTVFGTLLVAILALLYLPERCFQRDGLLLFFLTVGMTTSFIDYLTYPVASFGMPMILCLYRFPVKTSGEEWKRFFLCGFCWVLGYFGMWAGKWIIAGLFGNEQWFWANLFAKISERSSAISGEVTLSYLDVLKAVLSIFVKRAYLLLGLLVVAAWGIALIRGISGKLAPRRKPWARQSVLWMLACLPFAWFWVTKNHTFNHAYFTSRALCVTVFSLSAWLMDFVRSRKIRQ